MPRDEGGVAALQRHEVREESRRALVARVGLLLQQLSHNVGKCLRGPRAGDRAEIGGFRDYFVQRGAGVAPPERRRSGGKAVEEGAQREKIAPGIGGPAGHAALLRGEVLDDADDVARGACPVEVADVRGAGHDDHGAGIGQNEGARPRVPEDDTAFVQEGKPAGYAQRELQHLPVGEFFTGSDEIGEQGALDRFRDEVAEVKKGAGFVDGGAAGIAFSHELLHV